MIFTIIDQSTRKIDPPVLQQIAAACEEQLNTHVAGEWGGSYIVRVGTAEDLKDGEIPAYIHDDLIDAPGAAALHDKSKGVPIIFAALSAFTGLTTGEQSLSEGLSHEFCETVGDASASLWSDDGTGVEQAYELCLAGDTRVCLADGSRPTIEALARGGFFDVIASRNGADVIARAGHARLTGKSADTVVVRFTDGTSLRCTPEHRVLLTNGTYSPAGRLLVGDRLLSPKGLAPNAVDGGLVDTEDFREQSRRCVGSEYSVHVGLSELGAGMELAGSVVPGVHAVFGGGVEHVLMVRAGEKMIGPNTKRHVALVANVQPRRDRTERHLVGHPVGKNSFVADTKLPVSHRIFGTDPKPTSVIRLLDFQPETLLGGRGSEIKSGKTDIDGTVLFQSAIMGGAKSFRKQRTFASGNRAGLGHEKTVYSVQPAGKCDVYDLTVPGVRNFAVDQGVFVHNCDRLQGSRYEINGVVVANFLRRNAFFTDSRGPYDYLGVLQNQNDQTPGGYRIVRTASGDAHDEHSKKLGFSRREIGVGVSVTLTWAEGQIVKEHLARKSHFSSRSYRRGLRL